MAGTMDRFRGISAAVLTPMDADLVPNDAMLAEHCRWLLANGCDGLAVLGTTGEANSLNLKERIRVIESLVEAGIPGDTLIPGTGCCALTDTVNLTKAAVDAGAKGALMLPPFYYKNPSDDGLFAYFSEVIQRIGDSRLQIYLYHFPQMSATPISFNLIEMLIKAYPDTIAGMKDSSGDLDNMIGAARNFDNFHVLSGHDDKLLPLLEAGGAGCITACANVGSALAGAVYAGWRDGTDVTEVNEKLGRLRACVSQFVQPPALKRLMARHTGNDDWLNIRPPLMSLNEAQVQKLLSEFDSIDHQMAAAA